MYDGGPAFPRPGYYPDDPCDRMEAKERINLSHDGQGGMSLRDWFAGQALLGIASHPIDLTYQSKDEALAAKAKRCYEWADAMLKAKVGGK
jgi:hypothetical protein